MDIYQLTGKGWALSHNIYAPSDNPRWEIVRFLSRSGGAATKEQIYQYVPSASWHDIAKLKYKRVIEPVGSA